MSLQVWLPLTKDLRQQGLSSMTVENHNATLNTAGKLGSCYYFNGSQQWLQLSNNLGNFYNNDWSITCWLKPTDSTRSIILSEYSGTGASNVAIELTTARVVRLYWNGSPDINFSTAGALPLNEWTHLAITKQGRIVKLYFNGELKQTYTNSSDFSTRTSACQPRIGDDYRGNSGNSVSYQGYMNDFRMYDHCLSPMEVKELAKGLVLHYPLNRNGWGQENLILGSNGIFVSGLGSAAGSRAEFRSKSVGLLPIELNKTYTLSFNVKMILNTPSNKPYLLVYNTNYRGEHGGWISYNCNNDLAGNYETGDIVEKKIKITFTPTSFNPGSYTTDNIEFYSNYGSSNWFEISNIKLEEGSIATPWCPNSTDALATTMGLNGTTEYDCSGFCNNGTRNGTFDWTSNTAKYSVSQIFNGSNNAIQTPSLPTMITDKNYTIACWVYKTSIGTKGYQTIYGGPSGYELEARNGASGGAAFVGWNWGKPLAEYEFNKWNHFCFVHSDNDCKIYLNGEYISSGTAKASNPTGNYFIGAWNTATQQNYEGLMSDFRIYATALSADDVKSLYQNCATIDPDGTIRGQIRS